MLPSKMTDVINAMKKAGKIHPTMTKFEFMDAIKEMQNTGKIDPNINVLVADFVPGSDIIEEGRRMKKAQPELTDVINAMKKAGKIHPSMTNFEIMDAIKEMQNTGKIDPNINIVVADSVPGSDIIEERSKMKKAQQNTGPGEARKIIPIVNYMNPWETRHAPPDIRVFTHRLYEESKVKAFKAFAVHDYISFTAWARVWTQIKIVLELEDPSPFTTLASLAREILKKLQEKDDQECKLSYKSKTMALKSLSSYSYVSFADWARFWIRLNAASENPQPSPFEPLVDCAKKILRELLENDKS